MEKKVAEIYGKLAHLVNEDAERHQLEVKKAEELQQMISSAVAAVRALKENTERKLKLQELMDAELTKMRECLEILWPMKPLVHMS